MGLPVKHDCEEPFAFVAANEAGERLLYLTDSMYSPFRFKGLTTIMVECNYALDIIRENVADGVIDREHKNRVIRSHMSLDTVKGLLTANDLSKVEAIYLLHLSNDNSDEERFKREIQELTGKPVYVA